MCQCYNHDEAQILSNLESLDWSRITEQGSAWSLTGWGRMSTSSPLLILIRGWQESAQQYPSVQFEQSRMGTKAVHTPSLSTAQGRKEPGIQDSFQGPGLMILPPGGLNCFRSFTVWKTRQNTLTSRGWNWWLNTTPRFWKNITCICPCKQSTSGPQNGTQTRRGGEAISVWGVWFTTQVQSGDNTMFLLFKLFYSIFPAHKECTLVSTVPLCLCKLFWSKLSVNYFPNHRTTRSCWENGLCKNAVNCFCHRRKYNQ